jgi:hypothetical protein
VALGATLIVTDPLPVPDAPLAIESQSAFDVADQVHVDPVAIVEAALPPLAATDALVGEIE